MKKTVVLGISLILLTSTAWAGHFTEDFTSRAQMDSLYTSADWDTTAGELRLQMDLIYARPVQLMGIEMSKSANGQMCE